MSELVTVFLAGTATMFATGLGALPVHYFGHRAYDWRPVMIGVAIGAMGVASVVGLIEPGLDAGSAFEVFGGAALGAVLFFGIRTGLRRHDVSVGEMRGADARRAALIFAVLFAHSLPEGFAVGTAYASSQQNLGLFVILAIALQNIPEGTSVAIPMEDAGAGVWRQFWAAVATSIPQPIGAVLAYVLVDEIIGLLPISFGFAAGAMLMIVAVELIPDGFSAGTRVRASAGVAAGAAMILVLEHLVAI